MTRERGPVDRLVGAAQDGSRTLEPLARTMKFHRPLKLPICLSDIPGPHSNSAATAAAKGAAGRILGPAARADGLGRSVPRRDRSGDWGSQRRACGVDLL